MTQGVCFFFTKRTGMRAIARLTQAIARLWDPCFGNEKNLSSLLSTVLSTVSRSSVADALSVPTV